jgi:DNA modification methylase
MVAVGWSEAQRRAYVLADNKLALNAGWDTELLKVELAELKAEDFDLALTGFSGDELNKLLIEPIEDGQTEADETPEVQPDPVTRAGDVWVMGRHRLMCGDSTNPQHIERLMAGKEADICFTSPPYGQQRDYKSGGISDWDALMQGVFSLLPLKHDAQVLVNLGLIHRDGEWLPYWDAWIEWMRATGWRRFGWYVWDQGPGLPGDWKGRLAPSHEWVFHFNRVAERARKTKESKWAGHANHGSGLRAADGSVTGYTAAGKPVQDRKIPDSVIRVMRHKARGIEVAHPAVFPVDLVSEMLTAFSDPDDIVFEPFCGSGTQMISAQKNGRSCYGMELAPEYADVAVRRWQNFTSQTAILESDGRSFADLEAERKGGAA